jgi:DNA-binding beta-propeller fold protein YncE
MQVASVRRNPRAGWLAAVFASSALMHGSVAAQQKAAAPATAPAVTPEKPTNNYWVYVGAESADKLYRIRFGPGCAAPASAASANPPAVSAAAPPKPATSPKATTGTACAVVERTIEVGELPTEMEGPHGLVISKDGRFLHMTTGHGFPDGKYWQYELGPDTLVGPGLLLGNFPATIDVTPDGLYTFSSNFNLHGDMVPSSISAVYTPTMTEVAHIVTCTMPHGSRIDPTGRFHYSGCMMDDQLVEIDTKAFKVSRRFSVAKGKEGPLPAEGDEMLAMWIAGAKKVSKGKTADPAKVGYAAMGEMRHQMAPNSCSPTWAQPSSTGAKIYVTCNKADEILEIDRDSWTLTRRLKTGRGPYNLAVTPDGKLLLATLKQGAMFEVFELATGKSLAQIKNSTTIANGVVVSPDSRYAFVSSEGVGAAPGKVDVYDLKALARVGTVDVGQQAGGIAFWKMESAAEGRR